MGTNGSTMLEPSRQGLPPWDPAAVSDAACCALSAGHEAVREARHFTRGALEAWGLAERFDDVCLVVSELVTNALRHALPAARPHGPALDVGPVIRLHLLRWTGRLVCAVRDPGRDRPVVRDADALPDDRAESGRGLFLVASFSDGWGWHPLAGPLGGKVVWAQFRLANEGG